MASRPTRGRVPVVHAIRCDSQKTGFRSRPEALDAAESMMARGLVHPGCHITPYLCRRCGEWHVANKRIAQL
jgi:hypothetical protein